jgi:hypothetical protein
MHYTLFRLQVIISPTGRKETKETEEFHIHGEAVPLFLCYRHILDYFPFLASR